MSTLLNPELDSSEPELQKLSLLDRTTSSDGKSGPTTNTSNAPGVAHRLRATRSVLSLAIGETCVFAGLQGGDLVAWSLTTYEPICLVKAHDESLLGLYLSDDKELLFSSGGDSIVNVWCTKTLKRLYSIESNHDPGDIFTVVYSSNLKTVYCGGQNTSIQWCDLEEDTTPPLQAISQNANKPHKFFDSKASGEAKDANLKGLQSYHEPHGSGRKLSIRKDQHRLFAHNGYVYCMLLIRGLIEGAGHEVLLTGSGDGSVKIWELHQNGGVAPTEKYVLQNPDESVLSISVDGSFLYCGLTGGTVNIWNLDSRQIIKTLHSHDGDVWSLDIIKGVIISGGSDGMVKKFNSRFEEIGSWTAHEGKILASTTEQTKGKWFYATGGSDNTVALWDFTDEPTDSHQIPAISNDELVNTLATFIGFKTISGRSKFSGECNQGATFLRKHCKYLGAQTKLLATGQKTNPVVFAKFKPSSPTKSHKSVLFYGHYDVVGADFNHPKWNTDPFHLTSLNGYLYGRGVSDNKGPSLAALYAAAELYQTKQLGCEVTFLIEGEEESGSQGFAQTVRENKHLIGPVDWVLLANSYWLDDHIPCLTYGLRGVIHANLIVTSGQPDLHSGIDGSSLLDEPLKDLTLLLSTIVGPKGSINLPGFHDPVLPLTSVEKQRYDAIAEALLPHHPEIKDFESFTKSLMHRWREPSLTIHSVEVPGCKNSTTTIARKAKASLSIRLVPNQEVDDVASDLITYAQEEFAALDTQNTLTIEITGKADPWLGDPDNELFETLSQAVTTAWNTPSDDNYRLQNQLRPPYLPQQKRLLRTDSSDSIASNIERIIASSSPVSKPHVVSSKSPHESRIPTSSTLADSSSPSSIDPTIIPPDLDGNPPDLSASGSQPAQSNPGQPGSQSSTTSTERENQPVHPAHPVKPIYIREGGSIPTIRFLEKEFDAPAAHLPCGQASDNAHLDNERLRIENLYKSREIFKSVFSGH
ncbi:hypothetical protein FQN57_001673 [Myotisia sp. PD_48]|nr:hypothetical protein FQN57_001673 [Myotisia sp. PD_48]